MTEQMHSSFTVYTAEAAIPGYQRAWVWGTVTLAVLLCGALAGWLFSGVLSPRSISSIQPASGMADGAVLLAEQEAVNAQLRERISQLEQALGGDVCASTALKALGGKAENRQ
ncbi:MAG: hypothetical protein QG599_319 [Pseudomonadota bacterium]|nr:hypothetical protein [Pseudomonadota bacterium]